MYSDNEKKHKISIPSYTLAEELMNSISHGVGALMGLAMLVMAVSSSRAVFLLAVMSVVL